MPVRTSRATELGLLIVMLVLVSGCGMRRGPAPVRSPSGQLEVVTSVNQDKTDPTRHLCVIVEVRDRAGTALHREVTPASDTMRWSIAWAGDNAIILQSSDVGRYTIERLDNGTWEGSLK